MYRFASVYCPLGLFAAENRLGAGGLGLKSDEAGG
jgi:hypothetical protein